MSIWPTIPNPTTFTLAHIVGSDCFFCGETIKQGPPAIYWIPRTKNASTIHLHTGCARDFAMHLIKDSFGGVNGTQYLGTDKREQGN